MATFAYHTGWRRTEILTLEWRQVDFSAGTVRLDPGTMKNDDGRVFPFAVLPELKTMLEDQRAHTDRVQSERGKIVRHVFHRNGNPSRHSGATAACKATGHPGRLLRDFRRTAARNLVRAGVSEKVAMTLTGHNTRSVSDRYDIVNERDLRLAVRRLAGPPVSVQAERGADGG